MSSDGINDIMSNLEEVELVDQTPPEASGDVPPDVEENGNEENDPEVAGDEAASTID